MNILLDSRIDCYSVLLNTSIKEYLSIIDKAYESSGGLEGQRDPLKTSTAIRIRSRMIEDLEKGTILPPIVLGVVVPNEIFDSIEGMSEEDFRSLLNSQPKQNISIIDGMQRTTAISEVVKQNNKNIEDALIRTEYWIAKNTNSLIYRMLVLNTGQVPWDLRRQIEVVFRSMIQEMREKADAIEVLEIDDQKRRARAGQFQASQLMELFLIFGTRKEKIDIKEKVADEFTRLDFIEATGDEEFNSIFYEAINYLGKFDVMFDKYKPEESLNMRFKAGKDLFTSQPARAGFIAAIALTVLGRPGIHYESHKQQSRWEGIKKHADLLLDRLQSMNGNEVGNFLDLATLSELTSQKITSKVGDFEREFFLKAFRILIEEEFNLPSMTPCWRAY